MFTYGRQTHYAYTIVRPTLLSAPETLGNGTDGRIQCRCGHLVTFAVAYYDAVCVCPTSHLYQVLTACRITLGGEGIVRHCSLI